MACHSLQQSYTDISYFPSFEIMLDDLRDYRYYEKDMIHPNEMAQDYIWEQFSKMYFAQETQQFIQAWQKILRDLSHRPFNPHTEAHRQFLYSCMSKLKQWEEMVDIREEYQKLEVMLANTH